MACRFDQHAGERHVAERADGRVADVGGERPARVGILEKICDRVADEHFLPDANAHRGAFLGIDRLAPKVLLIKAHVDPVTAAKPVHEKRAPAELEEEEMQPGIVDRGQHFPEEDVDEGIALGHDGVKPGQPGHAEENRHEDPARRET